MATKKVAVGSYTRKTKSGKTVRVRAYTQKRDYLDELLKSDPSRPATNAKSGQFAGGSSVPVSPKMAEAKARVTEAATKAAKDKAKTSSDSDSDAKTSTKKKSTAKKTSTADKVNEAAEELRTKTTADKSGTKDSGSESQAPDNGSQTSAERRPAGEPGPGEQRAPNGDIRPAPPLVRGIPRGKYDRNTLSEDEQKQRAKDLMDRANQVMTKGDTQQRNSDPMGSKMAGGVEVAYSPERAKIHKEIIEEMMEDARQRGVPRDGKAIISGGLPGAGKSYVLQNRLGIDMDKYVVLNPDDFKEKLIERTTVPGTEDGKFGPLEMATVVHEESSDLSKMARDAFESSGYNVILDVTLGGAGTPDNPDKAKNKHRQTVEGLRERGYTVSGVFVDIPHEMSKESAKARYLGGWARWMNGEDAMGGRYVPDSVAANDISTEGYNSSNRDNFEYVKDLFYDYKTVDNSVRDAGAPLNVLEEGGNQQEVTADDPFVTNGFDPFDDPVAKLEALLARMRAKADENKSKIKT